MAQDFRYEGENGPIDRGYYVKLPDLDPKDRKPSGFLEDSDGNRVYLWIVEVTASFQIAGNFAQTVSERRWYPRNFSAPTITIMGVMPNQYQYNRLAEFVRQSQIHALKDTDGGSPLRFIMGAAGTTIPDRSGAGGMKGARRGYDMEGYIQSIKKGGERWVNAPTFQFDFLIAKSNQGLFTSGQANQQVLKNWTGFVSNKDIFEVSPVQDAPKSPGTAKPKTSTQTNVETFGEFFGSIFGGAIG